MSNMKEDKVLQFDDNCVLRFFDKNGKGIGTQKMPKYSLMVFFDDCDKFEKEVD